jgi:hypothetical protein
VAHDADCGREVRRHLREGRAQRLDAAGRAPDDDLCGMRAPDARRIMRVAVPEAPTASLSVRRVRTRPERTMSPPRRTWPIHAATTRASVRGHVRVRCRAQPAPPRAAAVTGSRVGRQMAARPRPRRPPTRP